MPDCPRWATHGTFALLSRERGHRMIINVTRQTCDIECKLVQALQKHIFRHHLHENIAERFSHLRYLTLLPGIGGRSLNSTDFSEFVHLFKKRLRVETLIPQDQEIFVRNPRKRSCPKLTTDVAILSQQT